MLKNRVLSKNKISVPDIDSVYKNRRYGRSKDPSIFPTVKYIYIAKSYESKKSYKIRGIPRRTKTYGIGVLTTKNIYYFSELHTRHKELTKLTSNIFQRIILSNYIITPNTKIVVSDNIESKSDPILTFLGIMSASIGCVIKHRNILTMLRQLNFLYKYVPKADRRHSLTKYNRKQMIRRLIEMDRFDFLTDPMWREKLSLMVKSVADSFIECAVGMLYMNLMDINRPRKVQYNKRKLMQKTQETIQQETKNEEK